jgi:hypothetical protein
LTVALAAALLLAGAGVDSDYQRAVSVLPEQAVAGWRVIVRDAARPFGTGLDQDEIFDADRREIYLYAHTETQTPTSSARAIVFSLVFALDARLGWSDDPAWRRLDGWFGTLSGVLHPLAHVANTHPDGFADARGMRSPRHGLATLAAHLLVPTPKDDLHCRLPGHLRLIRARFAEIDARWAAPDWPKRSPCGAFEAWADLDRLMSVEVCLAAPSSRQAASAFGHLFLRSVHRDAADPQREGVTRAFTFLAETGIEPGLGESLRGLVGVFAAVLFEKPFSELHEQYVVIEGRDLTCWPLDLDADERRRLFEATWTALHAAEYDYYFFDRNCGSLLARVVESSRSSDEPLRIPGSLGVAPTAVLDGMRAARNAAGRPLLASAPTRYRSNNGLARAAERRRAQAAARLSAVVPALAPLLADADSPSAERRVEAYRALVAPLSQRALLDADVQRWLSTSNRVELYISTRANIAALRVAQRRRVAAANAARGRLLAEVKATMQAAGPKAGVRMQILERGWLDPRPSKRAAVYMQVADWLAEPMTPALADCLRRVALFHWMFEPRSKARPQRELIKTLFEPEPKVPLAKQAWLGPYAFLAEPVAVAQVSEALLTAQRTRQAVHRARGSRAAIAVDAPDELGTRYSGFSRLDLGARGYDSGQAAVRLAGAALDEPLGDIRAHGVRENGGMTVLRTDGAWTWSDGGLRFLELESRLIGVRDTGRELRMDAAWHGIDGSGLAIDWGWRRGGGGRALASVEALWILAAGPRLADHLLISAGPVIGSLWDVPDRGALAVGGLRGALEARVRLGAHVLVTTLAATPLVEWGNVTPDLLAEAVAGLRLRVLDEVWAWMGPAGLTFVTGVRVGAGTLPVQLGGREAGVRFDLSVSVD